MEENKELTVEALAKENEELKKLVQDQNAKLNYINNQIAEHNMAVTYKRLEFLFSVLKYENSFMPTDVEKVTDEIMTILFGENETPEEK